MTSRVLSAFLLPSAVQTSIVSRPREKSGPEAHPHWIRILLRPELSGRIAVHFYFAANEVRGMLFQWQWQTQGAIQAWLPLSSRNFDQISGSEWKQNAMMGVKLTAWFLTWPDGRKQGLL